MSVPHSFTAEDSEMLDGNLASDFAMASQISTLQDQIDLLMSALNAVESNVSSNTASIGSNSSTIGANSATIVTNMNDIGVVEGKTQYISVSGTEMVITGANLNIVSGAGETSATVNGLGNLIVGYNEQSNGRNTRTSSHNLIVGTEHSYSSFGGLVAGNANTISGDYSSVSGGSFNEASGFASSVSAGGFNTTSSDFASVSGGDNHEADGSFDWRAGFLFEDL